jgi:hypothetical protein
LQGTRARGVVLWSLFFLICLGLGYPTLNRYDPRQVPGLYDAKAYSALVTGSPLQEDQADLSHRVLVPYLAKPIFRIAQSRLHTWDPAFFALLVVNSFFSASTAYLLVIVGRQVAGEESAAIVAGLIYLVDFAVANLNLAGYVDSSVNCLLMIVVWSMLTERWWLLPVLGALGASAKETFIPLAATLILGWWLTTFRRDKSRFTQLACAAVMMVVAFATLILLMGHVSPGSSVIGFAASRRAESGSGFLYLAGLVRCLSAREFLYTFVWLLPLGLWGIARVPRPWVIGAACAGMAGLAMGAYDDALGNATRAIFSAIGPPLSLSVAMFLVPTRRPDQTF